MKQTPSTRYIDIPFTSLAGKVSELCREGDAEAFIQPWYTPIPTTPETTGMAVGGIGNSFNLTPLGTTPSLNFLPGLHVTAGTEPLQLQDFYVAVKPALPDGQWQFDQPTELYRFAEYFPLTWRQQPLLDQQLSAAEQCQRLSEACASGELWMENQQAIERWQLELSPITHDALNTAPQAPLTQRRLLLDVYDGLLGIRPLACHNLSSASSSVNGQPTIDPEQVAYRALYPTAEYQYRLSGDVQLRRKVTSPIVRHHPELCALPLHWTTFEVTNNSSESRTITLLQSQRNIVGSFARKVRPGVQDAWCELIEQPVGQQQTLHPLQWQQERGLAIRFSNQCSANSDLNGEMVTAVVSTAAHANITAKPMLYCCQLADTLQGALASGRLSREFHHGVYSQREATAGLLCITIELAAGTSECLSFAQVMDFPTISCQHWHSEKRYLQDWQSAEERALNIMRYWLPARRHIEQQIVEQQQQFHSEIAALFTEPAAQLRFATMALNTLSFLADAAIWDRHDTFLVRECADYPFFNSLDVYFYGSFAILYLLPALDGQVLKHFAKAILNDDQQPRRYWEYTTLRHADLCDPKYAGPRSPYGAVVHDLGSPFDIEPNAYTWHNVRQWKDLAPKFVLMVMRNYQLTQDRSLLQTCWPAIKASLDELIALQEPGAALPLTHGTDDTFDNLTSYGISVYCGSLWIAGLDVAAKLAGEIGAAQDAIRYQTLAQRAKTHWQRALWDEQRGYFHFCATPILQRHITDQRPSALCQLMGVATTLTEEEWLAALNAYIDGYQVESTQSKLAQRRARKHQLLTLAPEAWTDHYRELLDSDRDDSFAEPLLADTYLLLLQQPPINDAAQRSRQLDFLYRTNFMTNSPLVGIANMVTAEGAPLPEFQAQDVWLGVQFSIATALLQHNKIKPAQTLLMQVYDVLYERARIPFAAPEGFNTSVPITLRLLQERLPSWSATEISDCWQWLQHHWLLDDGRVRPELPRQLSQFEAQSHGYGSQLSPEKLPILHHLLLTTGMKYTAGRYFRPGMIFALYPSLLKG